MGRIVTVGQTVSFRYAFAKRQSYASLVIGPAVLSILLQTYEPGAAFLIRTCESDEDHARLACHMYINGFISGAGVVGRMVMSPSIKEALPCIPGDVTVPQMTGAVLKGLRKKPQAGYPESEFMVMAALIEAFPCKR